MLFSSYKTWIILHAKAKFRFLIEDRVLFVALIILSNYAPPDNRAIHLFSSVFLHKMLSTSNIALQVLLVDRTKQTHSATCSTQFCVIIYIVYQGENDQGKLAFAIQRRISQL